MPTDAGVPSHTDRVRAESFGSAASDYDRFRPRYPTALIADLAVRRGLKVLDVGAGTAIASAQLGAAGADVLAVEPDARMAAIAATKGFLVEQAKFEDWAPAGRVFDLVLFAQSFHWVDPDQALPKTASLLAAGGRLALIWNRVEPTDPPQSAIDELYGDVVVARAPSVGDADRERFLLPFSRHRFTVDERTYTDDLHYSVDEWLGVTFTYSAHLTLPAEIQSDLRRRLRARLPASGVAARNNALALICTPTT